MQAMDRLLEIAKYLKVELDTDDHPFFAAEMLLTCHIGNTPECLKDTNYIPTVIH